MEEVQIPIQVNHTGTGNFIGGNGLAVDPSNLDQETPPINYFEDFHRDASSDGEMYQLVNLPAGTTHIRLLFNISWRADYLPPFFNQPEGPGNYSRGQVDGTIIITVDGQPIFVEAHTFIPGPGVVQYTDRQFVVPASGLTDIRIRAFGTTSIDNARFNFEFGFTEVAARNISVFWTDFYAQINPVEVAMCDCCCCAEG